MQGIKIRKSQRGNRKQDRIKKFKISRSDKKRKNKQKSKTLDKLRKLKEALYGTK